MTFQTQTDKNRAWKKVLIAIDKMIDLEDMGAGCDAVARLLDSLRGLESTIAAADVHLQENVMRKQDVIGRKIVGIKREGLHTTAGYENCVVSLILDNGNMIYARAHEMQDVAAASLELVDTKPKS